MSEVRKLNVVQAKPAEADIRAEVILLLERYLEEAKRGEVSEIFILAQHTNAEWTDRASSTLDLDKWVGRLEMTKLEWIDMMRMNRRDVL